MSVETDAEWDKVSPKKREVGHSKATFRNRIRHHAGRRLCRRTRWQAARLSLPTSGPFGAVKEQSSGLYAQKMAELGFLQSPLTRPIPARAARPAM